jgi:hypothetical protein
MICKNCKKKLGPNISNNLGICDNCFNKPVIDIFDTVPPNYLKKKREKLKITCHSCKNTFKGIIDASNCNKCLKAQKITKNKNKNKKTKIPLKKEIPKGDNLCKECGDSNLKPNRKVCYNCFNSNLRNKRNKKEFDSFDINDKNFILEETSIKGMFKNYTTNNQVLIAKLINDAEHDNFDIINNFLEKLPHISFKIHFSIEIDLGKFINETIVTREDYFDNDETNKDIFTNYILHDDKSITYKKKQSLHNFEELKNLIKKIFNQTDVSGLTIITFKAFTIHLISTAVSAIGAKYEKLPKVVIAKVRNIVLNIKNFNNKCFYYCIAAYFHPKYEFNKIIGIIYFK